MSIKLIDDIRHVLELQHTQNVLGIGLFLRSGAPVVLLLYANSLDNTFVDDERVPFATGIAERTQDLFVIEGESESLRKLTSRVCKKLELSLCTLLLAPCGHHKGVIHADDHHLIDALGFQFVQFVQVGWHMSRRSGRSEGAGHSSYDDFLLRAERPDVDRSAWSAIVQVNIGHFIFDLHSRRSHGACKNNLRRVA
eukprot:TRINITY_DN116708_c0_g1_i1.p1 TRINITY_DN116708_c0_g1~~TRINITY_DN116708_c0_g1_i1.p1  ORF type:complete len:196 (-),score=0.04 TRINITY_DN116708_c0_g1_i1:47-634(-)